MKIVLFALAFGMLHGVTPVLANAAAPSLPSIESAAGLSLVVRDALIQMTAERSPGEFVISESGAPKKQTTSTVTENSEPGAVLTVPSENGDTDMAGSSSNQGGPTVTFLRRPLHFDFLTRSGRKAEGITLNDVQIDPSCSLLGAKDDVEVFENLAKCVRLSENGNYLISGVPEVVVSPDMVRFVIPVVISRFKAIYLEAAMKDGSAIPVNCSPQVSLSSSNGFATVFPMVEDVGEDRRKLRYKVELPEYQTVPSSTFRIITSRSSGCRLASADLGLEQGKTLGSASLDESGASFSAEFVPADPALLIVLTRGEAATADARLGKEWRRQASAIIEAAFEAARQNFSQVIVVGYTEASEYTVLLKVPKTQFREQLKKIKNDNEFGFKIDKAGEALDASLQVDLEQQISELASQGVSVLTVIYGRQQPEGLICDFGSLANNQFIDRLGRSLIIDVLPTKAYNVAIKDVRANESASGVVIVAPESENFSSIDCVKYAGLIENREFSPLSRAFALPLLKSEEDLSGDYLELSRKWIGGLLETSP